MKKILFVLAVILQGTLCAQESGFYFTRPIGMGSYAVEIGDGEFIINSKNYWGESLMPSSLIKISNQGELLREVQLGDNYTEVTCLYQDSDEGVLYAVGCQWDYQREYMDPFIASFDYDLNILGWENISDIPIPYTTINDAKAIVNDRGKVLLVLSSFSELYYLVFDLNGTLESFCSDPHLCCYVGSLCLMQDGSGDFGHYREQPGMVRITEQLEMEPLFDVNLLQESQWMGSDTIHSVFVSPSRYPTVLPLTDSTFLFAEETVEFWWDHYHPTSYCNDENTAFFKCDSDGAVVNCILVDTRNDTLERPAYYKAMDLQYRGFVYLCSFQHLEHSSSGSEIGQNNIILMKADPDLNLIWERRYCLGSICHKPLHILATGDGGCLITGYLSRDGTSDGLFALKLNMDGTLETRDTDVGVFPYRFYPNPVTNELCVEFLPDVTPQAVELYDIQGHLVRSQVDALGCINMEHLPIGTYTLRIAMSGGKVFSEKVVKQ